MKKRQKVWMYSPPKSPKPKVPENIKLDLQKRAKALVDTVLKPKNLKPPPEDIRLNYIIDIYTRWHSSYFYFCAKYHSPGPNAISPYFELKFARMEYVGNGRFNLSYMRHTGKWAEIFVDLSIEECFESIKEDPFFYT